MEEKRVLLLKFGELFLKGKNKHEFEKLLMTNIRRKLSGHVFSLEFTSGRMIVENYDESEEKILMIYSKSPVISQPLNVNQEIYEITAVSMGNPHAVVYMDDVKNLKIEEIGPWFEKSKAFPESVNTEFVRVIDRHTVEMRVWERGSGETLACGTGACAVTVSSVLNGYTDEEVTVHLLGGDLKIFWDRKENLVYMTGPAEVVFDGEVTL